MTSDHEDDGFTVAPGSTHPDGGSVVVKSAIGPDGERYAAIVPSAVRKMRGEPLAAYSLLQRSALALEAAQLDVEERVATARRLGVSWASIGWALGVTAQAARQRYFHAEGDHFQ